jgi:hypothetical protein
MTHLFARLSASRERRERVREIAHVTPEEITALGLSREEFTALALMPSEQIGRMEEMARINGCDPAHLDRDRDLQIAAALTCLGCTEGRRCHAAVHGHADAEDTDFCPNAETYRMLAAE